MAIKSSNVAARVEPEIKEKEKAKAILAQLGISAFNDADFSNAEGGEADTQKALDIVCTVSINEDSGGTLYNITFMKNGVFEFFVRQRDGCLYN